MPGIAQLKDVPHQIETEINNYKKNKRLGEDKAIEIFCQIVTQSVLYDKQWFLRSIENFVAESKDIQQIFTVASSDAGFLCVDNLLKLIHTTVEQISNNQGPNVNTTGNFGSRVVNFNNILCSLIKYNLISGAAFAICVAFLALGLDKATHSFSKMPNLEEFVFKFGANRWISLAGFGSLAFFTAQRSISNYRKMDKHLAATHRLLETQQVLDEYLQQLANLDRQKDFQFVKRKLP